MKIHYLITSLEAGGAEFSIPDIAHALRSFGHDLEITALEARDEGAAPRLTAASLSYSYLYKNRTNMFRVVAKLIPIILNKKPDLIITSLNRATTAGQIVGKILNIPVVSWKNSTNIRFFTRIAKWMSTLWIADSSFVAKALYNDLKIPPKRISAWPLFLCKAPEEERHYWNGHDTLHIGSTGQLYAPKNYSCLIEGLALFIERHPDLKNKIHLSLAGDGPQRLELEDLVQQHRLNENVSFLGFVDDVPSFLKSLHVYAQPSHYEGMCIAAHEAMAAGLPVIATPVGELSFSVKEGISGFILPKNGNIPHSISNIFEYIFDKPKCLQTLGRNAKSYTSTHFSKEQYMSCCRKTLNKIQLLTNIK